MPKKKTKIVLTAGIFVGLVLAIGFAITEQLLVDALAITAGQLSLGADRLVGSKDGQHLARL